MKFKFKNWSQHRTNNVGQLVTLEEKQLRAERIAVALADHKLWRSHGRALNIGKLRRLGLEIDDMFADPHFCNLVRSYNDPLSIYVERMGLPIFMHNHILHGES